MTGKIIKGIAGFYYVLVESAVYECKAKGIFRKEKKKPLVGDNVEIEVLDSEEMTGNLVSILSRKNELIRPAVANVDQSMVIFALESPKPNIALLDRFLLMMEWQQVDTVICFNKEDLADQGEAERLSSIYENCGYQVLVCSAEREGYLERENHGCGRAIRCWEVVPDQSASGECIDGDWGDQSEAETWKAHYQTFPGDTCQ